MAILEKIRNIYGVKTNKGLLFNVIKDIVFYSLFFYVALNSNSYCVSQGLPTVEQYKQGLIGNTTIYHNFTKDLINLTQK
jgi:hypothetical protein